MYRYLSSIRSRKRLCSRFLEAMKRTLYGQVTAASTSRKQQETSCSIAAAIQMFRAVTFLAFYLGKYVDGK